MAKKPITTVPYSTSASGDYYIFVNDNGEVRQVDIDILSKFLNNVTWTSLTGKPFKNIDSEEFAISGDTLNINGYHTHSNTEILNKITLNESGELVYDGSPIGEYTLPVAKEDTLGGVKPDGTTITIDEDGTIHGANTYILPTASINTLGGVKVDGDTIKINDGVISADVIGNWSAGTSYPVGYFVVYDNKFYQCIKANSDTEWTESNWTPIGSAEGIGINNWSASTLYKVGDLVINETTLYQCNIEHTSGDTFDETESVNWTALSGVQGEKGDDGYSPTASVEQTDTGCTITIVDKNGTTTANLTNGINGENGTTPHIDESTRHWFVGETDTGITAEGIVEINTDCVILYATLLASGWSDTAPYTQTVSVTSILASNVPVVDISYSDDSSLWDDEETAYNYLTKVETADGSIVATCRKTKPETDFTIKLKVAGDISGINVVTQSEFDELKALVASANTSLENTLNGGAT